MVYQNVTGLLFCSSKLFFHLKLVEKFWDFQPNENIKLLVLAAAQASPVVTKQVQVQYLILFLTSVW